MLNVALDDQNELRPKYSPLIIQRTRDIDLIKTVLCHPEIYPCIGDDSSPAVEDYEPEMDSEFIIGVTQSKVIALAIYTLHAWGKEMHIQVIPQYRKEYARKFARGALRFNHDVLFAKVPMCFSNVIAFAKEFNFNEIDIVKDGYKKGDITADIKILRREIGE